CCARTKGATSASPMSSPVSTCSPTRLPDHRRGGCAYRSRRATGSSSICRPRTSPPCVTISPIPAADTREGRPAHQLRTPAFPGVAGFKRRPHALVGLRAFRRAVAYRTSMILARLALLMLVGVIAALTPAALAGPPDQAWVAGLYDNADYDDAVL